MNSVHRFQNVVHGGLAVLQPKVFAKSIKFMFDESLPLPKEYVDKQGKECVTQLKGRNLDSIKEFQDETLKSILLCEEFSINYKFIYYFIISI